MSDEQELAEKISRSMEKAAQDTIAEEGGMITGFVVMATFMDKNGDRGWAFANQDGQMVSTSLGMIEIMHMTVKGQAECLLFHDHDHEDEED